MSKLTKKIIELQRRSYQNLIKPQPTAQTLTQCACDCDCHYVHDPEYGQSRECQRQTANANGICDECARHKCTPSEFPKYPRHYVPYAMPLETCDKCHGLQFYIRSSSVNGGYTAERECVKCGDIVEIIDTYSDN